MAYLSKGGVFILTPSHFRMSRSSRGNKSSNIVHQTIKQRSAIYGDPRLSHENIGLSWTGMIQQHYGLRLDHPLPDWLVELMMVQFKCQRAARVFHADNFVDANAYLHFAERDQKMRQP